MQATTAPDVKRAILALIQALPDAETWDIDWGFQRNPERSWIMLGAIEWQSSEWVTNRTREEDYSITLVVNLKRRKATTEETETEAIDVMQAIEAQLHINANASLGVFGVTMAELVPKKLDSWPADEFCEAQFEATVHITARF